MLKLGISVLPGVKGSRHLPAALGVEEVVAVAPEVPPVIVSALWKVAVPTGTK